MGDGLCPAEPARRFAPPPLMRGLYDLADMAHAKGDAATYSCALGHASDLARRVDSTWWNHAAQQYWIGQTPMGSELHVGRAEVAAAVRFAHGSKPPSRDTITGQHTLTITMP